MHKKSNGKLLSQMSQISYIWTQFILQNLEKDGQLQFWILKENLSLSKKARELFITVGVTILVEPLVLA